MSNKIDDAASLADAGLVNPTAKFVQEVREIRPVTFMDQAVNNDITDFRPIPVSSGFPEDTDEDPKDSSVLEPAVSLQSVTATQDSDSKPVKVIPASVGKGNTLPKA